MLNNKKTVLIVFLIFKCIFINQASRVQLSLTLAPPTQANATSASLASGNVAATSVDASSQATTGQTAIGASTAQANTDKVHSQSGVAAVSQASNNDKLVQTTAHEDSTAVRTTGQEDNAAVDRTDTTNFATEYSKKTSLNNTVTNQNQVVSQKGFNQTLTNQYETIQDSGLDSIGMSTSNTGTTNNYTEIYTREITITLDDDVIVEKMISRDERVIVVTAAKYILPQLVQSDKDAIQKLVNTACNCNQAKNYLIELLAESY